MYLIHESTIKEANGMIEISVIVVNGKKNFKRYTYDIPSQKAAEMFHSLYRKGSKCHGKALSILNKSKI